MTLLWDNLDATATPPNKHRRHRMHSNSLKAEREERESLNARARLILDDLRRNGPGTDREIRDRLGYEEMNQVRPRITELIDAKLVRELERVKCKTTGKRVRRVAATGAVLS